MSKSAQLCAHDLKPARLGRSEMQWDNQPRNDVLLNTQFGNIEGMNHVLAMHGESDGPADGDRQRPDDDVIPRVDVIFRIQTKKISITVPHAFRMNGAELAVWTRITEVKGKLSSGHINRKRSLLGRRHVNGRPDLGTNKRQNEDFQAHQDDGERDERAAATGKILDLPSFVVAEFPCKSGEN